MGIAGAIAGDDANRRELRRACLMPRAFCAWAQADHATQSGRRESPSNRISQAAGCGVGEIATAARSIMEARGLVVDAWMAGRTNAYAGNADRKAKDMKRRARGFEHMRRRRLITLGRYKLIYDSIHLPDIEG